MIFHGRKRELALLSRLDMPDRDGIGRLHPPECVTLTELDRDLSEWSE